MTARADSGGDRPMITRVPSPSTGQRAWLAGDAAEDIVARHYERRGYALDRRRWRGRGGEIDLILRRGALVVFVEVKQSRDFARAAQSLRPAQMQRLLQSAEDFLGGEPCGSLTECRFDVAFVDGGGICEIVENALGQG
ncbi:YraN family protein [Sulfitobacter sp. LCG007]